MKKIKEEKFDILTMRLNHRHGEEYILSFKNTFLKNLKGKPISNFNLYSLFASYDLAKFLHNDVGPALTIVNNPHDPKSNGRKHYYLHGCPATKEQIKQIKKRGNDNKKSNSSKRKGKK